MMWAAIVGNVTTEDPRRADLGVAVRPVGDEWAYSVVHRMSGTPPRSWPAFTSPSVSARKKFGWMQA
jgi:hypothetical protein